MRKINVSLFVVSLLAFNLTVTGCGEAAVEPTASTNEIQDFLDANPGAVVSDQDSQPESETFEDTGE